MAQGRHKRKKPLVRRVAPGVFTALLIGGVGYNFVDLQSSPSTPARSTQAAQSSLPTVPAGHDQAYQEDEISLCADFVAAEIRCSVSYQLSASEAVGALISQTPEAGLVGDSVELVYSKGPARVVVPILSGLSKEDALERLWVAGLQVGKEKTVEAAAELDTVVEASELPSSSVPNGARVDLSYSSGMVMVPDWVGKPRELVEAEANQYGIRVEFKEKTSESPAGVVLNQASAGKSVPFRTVIRVVVSKASEQLNEVPDVVGMSQDEAIALLASQGFVKITTVVNGAADDAAVLSTAPEAGTSAALGDEIILTVGTAQ